MINISMGLGRSGQLQTNVFWEIMGSNVDIMPYLELGYCGLYVYLKTLAPDPVRIRVDPMFWSSERGFYRVADRSA